MALYFFFEGHDWGPRYDCGPSKSMLVVRTLHDGGSNEKNRFLLIQRLKKQLMCNRVKMDCQF